METNTALLALLPDYLPEHDKIAAVRLVQSVLAHGHLITVSDGMETVVRRSADATDILKAMGSTDCDFLHAYAARRDADGKLVKLGMFQMIWGNSPGETIADSTANDFCDAHYTCANEPWADD